MDYQSILAIVAGTISGAIFLPIGYGAWNLAWPRDRSPTLVRVVVAAVLGSGALAAAFLVPAIALGVFPLGQLGPYFIWPFFVTAGMVRLFIEFRKRQRSGTDA